MVLLKDKNKKETTDPVAIKANILHNFVTQKGWEMVKAAIACGKLLTEKKNKLRQATKGYGNFGKWVEANLDFSWRTVNVYMQLYEHQAQIYDMEFDSIRGALHFIRGDDRITPGKLAGDEKILRRNIVSPIKIVKARLKKMPSDPIHYDIVMRVVAELHQAIAELLQELE